jgi:hypothetical protein
MAAPSRQTGPTFLAGLLLVLGQGVSAQLKMDAYPDHRDVLHRLYGTYRVEREGATAKLAKTPDGWWLHYEVQDSVADRYQLWSYPKRKFLKPDLQKLERGEPQSRMGKFEDTDWTATYYRACPYFGYRGWFLDVIREYGDKQDLPSYARYGLARAYSSAARCRLDDLQAEGPAGYAFLSGREDVLTTGELENHLDLFNRACRTYAELNTVDPAFETHIGEVALKRDHEHMSGYMDLTMAEEHEAAVRCVPRDAYPAFYRDLARAFLASCDSNAILFTNGDTDTFPLWFVQVVEGYRRDVLVLNLSLLNASRYVSAMRPGQLGSMPAQWRLPDGFYWSDRSSYVLLQDGADTLDLEQVVGQLASEGVSTSDEQASPITLSGRRFSLRGPRGTVTHWGVSMHYLLRSTLAVFDLLSQYAGTRPFHWAVTTGPDSYLGLSEHMALQGLTYKLILDSTMVASTHQGIPEPVIAGRSKQVFEDLFANSGNDTATIGRTRLVTNYILQATKTAETLALEGDTAGAVQLVLDCLTAFPNERWPFTRVVIKPIELLWELGHGPEADSIAQILVHNLKTRPEVVGPVDAVTTSPDELRIREAVMERLRTMATRHERTAFRSFLDAQPKGWPDPLVIKQHWPGATRPKE